MQNLTITIIPVTLFQQNCALLVCTKTKKAAVIDPGGDLPRIMEAIRQSGATVEKIFITHGHIDHIGAAAALHEATGAPIEGPHIDDAFLIDNAETMGRSFNIPGRAFTPARWLQEGDEIAFGDVRFDVLHCPGHSPGSVAFVNKPMNLALVGDVLFQGSIGRTDLPGSDHAKLISSIKTKLFALGDDMQFLCGHGPGGTIGRERASNPFLVD